MRQYLVQSKSNQPLVIYGESGCGKTSVLSKVASLAHTWLGDVRPVVILRYLGKFIDGLIILKYLHMSFCLVHNR